MDSYFMSDVQMQISSRNFVLMPLMTHENHGEVLLHLIRRANIKETWYTNC